MARLGQLRRGLGIGAWVVLAACGSVPTPPSPVAPSARPTPTPTPVASATVPPLTAAGLLGAGESRALQLAPGAELVLLAANPTEEAATLVLAPAAAPPGARTPSPGVDAPRPLPTASSAGVPDFSPFGSGFGFAGAGGLEAPGAVPPPAPEATAPQPTVSVDSPTAPPSAFGLALGARVPPTTRQVQALSQAGATTSFWINDGGAQLAGDESRGVKLRLVGPHVDFYVDLAVDTGFDQAVLERMSAAFEGVILPKLTPIFGTPTFAAGERIAVVISPRVGANPAHQGLMGYFWPRDVLPAGGSGTDLRQHSNQRHALFISTRLIAQPDVTAFGTLAHEYQHMIMFDAKTRSDGVPHTEATWLDEGLAMWAMDLAGYGLAAGDRYVTSEIVAFEQAPASYSLTDWTHNPNGYSYGLSYLFVRYMIERLGPGVVHELQSEPLSGESGLENVFRRHGTDFVSVYLDWARQDVAGFVPPPPGAFDPKGVYGTTRLAGALAWQPEDTQRVTLRPWSAAPVKVDGFLTRPRGLALTADQGQVVVQDGRGQAPW